MGKRPYALPEEQRERLRREEMMICERLMAFTNNLEYAREDLKERLECVPYGTERLNMMRGNAESLLIDIMGTVPAKQRKHLKYAGRDFIVVVQPKYTPSQNRVSVPIEEFKELTDLARFRCKSCAETGDGARKCKLYKWLEADIPLDDYGDGLMCPYSTIGWKDEDEE